MRCHNGIPPNRTGISWSQILTARDRNIALVSRFPDAQRDDGGTCSRNGMATKESLPLRSPALFPIRQIPANDHWEPLAKKGVKVAFLHISGGL